MRSLYLQTKFATYTACPCTGEQNGRLKRNALTNAKDPKWITDRATRMKARSRCRRKLLRERSLARLEALDLYDPGTQLVVELLAVGARVHWTDRRQGKALS